MVTTAWKLLRAFSGLESGRDCRRCSVQACPSLDFDRLPRFGAHVVGVGAEVDGELKRYALDGDGEREDGEWLAELERGEAIHAGAERFDRAGEFRQTRDPGAAAVEADEGVAWSERECRTVKELLDCKPRGEQVRRLAHLECAFGCRPLVGAG